MNVLYIIYIIILKAVKMQMSVNIFGTNKNLHSVTHRHSKRNYTGVPPMLL